MPHDVAEKYMLFKKRIYSAYAYILIAVIATGAGYYVWRQYRTATSTPAISIPRVNQDYLMSLRGEYGTHSYQPSFDLTVGTTTPHGFWFVVESLFGAHSCTIDGFATTTDTQAHFETKAEFAGESQICTLDFNVSKPNQISVKESNCRSFCGVQGPGFENTYVKNVTPKEPDIAVLVDPEFVQPLKVLISERLRHLFTECTSGHPDKERKGTNMLQTSGLPGLYTTCGSAILTASPDRVWAIVLDPTPEKDGFPAGKETSALYFTNVKTDINAPPSELKDWIDSQVQGKMYCMNAPHNTHFNFCR